MTARGHRRPARHPRRRHHPLHAGRRQRRRDGPAAQADRLIGAGVHGLVTTGTTGEFPTLTPQEYRRVIEVYVQAAAGRVPVVAGVGALPPAMRSTWPSTPSGSARTPSCCCRRSTAGSS